MKSPESQQLTGGGNPELDNYFRGVAAGHGEAVSGQLWLEQLDEGFGGNGQTNPDPGLLKEFSSRVLASINVTLPEHIDHKKTKLGICQKEILVALDQNQGVILGPRPHLVVRDLYGRKSDPSAYKVASRRLEAKNAVVYKAHGDEESELSLTARGSSLVETVYEAVERYSEDGPEQKIGRPYLYAPTTVKILEHLSDQALRKGNNGNWLYFETNEIPCSQDVAAELEMEPDVFGRKLTELVYEKRYVEVKKNYDNHIINIRISEEGTSFLDAVRQYAIEKEPSLLDEDEVYEADQMVETCIELAAEIGLNGHAKTLKQRRDQKHFFEMSKKEFQAERQLIIDGLNWLRKEYAATIKRQQLLGQRS